MFQHTMRSNAQENAYKITTITTTRIVIGKGKSPRKCWNSDFRNDLQKLTN